MKYAVVIFLLLSLVGFASLSPIVPPITVSSTEPGIRYQPFEPRPKVELEIFIELNCGDSLAAWPIMKQVQEHYTNQRLDLRVQQLPLPYHRNGFLSTQGLYVIEEQTPDFVFDYIEAVLLNSPLFSTSNTVNQTETQVLDQLADVAVAATGIDKNLFISEIGNKRSYTIGVWKYGVKRAVAGTPTYFVNGVDLVVGTNFVPSFVEWITFLDPIINSP